MEKFKEGTKVKVNVPKEERDKFNWVENGRIGYIQDGPSIEDGKTYYWVRFYAKSNKKRTFRGGFSEAGYKENHLELA